jgi:RecA-family ATPase
VGGKAIIGGAAKSNKSFVVLNAALDIAKGRPLFDAHYKDQTPVFPVSKPWKVLLFENEIGEQGLKNRLRAMVPPEEALCEFYIKSKDLELRFDTQEGLAAIEREICNVEPQVVIFDPLSKYHGADENSAQEMANVMRKGDYLIQKYGVTLVYVHHTGLAAFDPQNMRRGGARLRGSSAIFADVDTYIELANISGTHSAEPTLKLSPELRQGEPMRPQYVKRQKNGRIVYIGEETT